MRLPAAFNGEVPEPGKGAVCKTAAPCMHTVRGSNPFLSAKLFERSGTRFEFVLARFVPVRRFTLWANPRFTVRALAWHPFVLATVTTIPFLPDGDQSHKVTIPR